MSFNNCQEDIIFNWVLALPEQTEGRSVYFVKNGSEVTMYVTDGQGVPYLVGTAGGDITLTSPNGTISINGYEIDIDPTLLQQISNINLQQVLENGSIGFVNTDIVLRRDNGAGGFNKMELMQGQATIGTPKRGLVADDVTNGGEMYFIQDNIKYFVPDKNADDTIAMLSDLEGESVQSVTGYGVDNTDPNNPVIQEIKDLPEDLYIATNPSGTTITYKSDIYRYLDLQPEVSVTITMTNEVVRLTNGDFYFTGNFIDNSTPAIAIVGKGGKLVNNELVFESFDSVTLPISKIHGSFYHRGFIYMTNRTDDITLSTRILKINPYDLSDIKYIDLPVGDLYVSPTDIQCYKNKIYTLTGGSTSGAAFIEFPEDLSTYTVLFTAGTNGNRRIGRGSPVFTIHNDEIYIPTYYNITDADRYNRMGVSVYNFAGTELRFTNSILVTTGLTSSLPITHWMTIFNDKLILNVSYGLNHKHLVRLDAKTLAFEEQHDNENLFTDDNSLFSDGYLYMNEEVIPGDPLDARLLKIKYNDFTDITVEIPLYNNGYGSHGSLNPLIYPESLKNKLSDFQNDIVEDTIVDGVLTKAPSQNAVFDALTLKAPLSSPALTGVPTAPTAASGTNTTQIATTAFVTAAVASGGVTIDAVPTDGSNNAVSSNGTFDALTLKANDAAVVHKTGGLTETIDGSKTLTGVTSLINSSVPLMTERLTASTSTANSAYTLRATSAGDMVDGFGSLFSFHIQDNAGVSNAIGQLVCVRNGADNNGKFILRTINAGTSNDWFTVDNLGVATFLGTVVVPTPTLATQATNKGYVDGLFLSGSAALDFPSTNSASSSDLTVTVTGAAVGDPVFLGTPTTAVLANTSYSAWVSATNTVTVRFNNYSALTANPSSGTFKVKIIK